MAFGVLALSILLSIDTIKFGLRFLSLLLHPLFTLKQEISTCDLHIVGTFEGDFDLSTPILLLFVPSTVLSPAGLTTLLICITSMSPTQTMCFLMRCALAPIPENVTGTCRLLFLVSGVLPLTENMKIFGNTTVFSLFLFPQTGGGYGRCDAATAMRRQRQSRRGTGAPRALARAHVPCPRDVRLGSRLGPGPALDSRRVSVSRLLQGG